MSSARLELGRREKKKRPVTAGRSEAAPSNVDAERRVGLLPAPLVDALGSFHHVLHRLVVAQFEFVDHLLTVLDHADLSNDDVYQGVQTHDFSETYPNMMVLERVKQT